MAQVSRDLLVDLWYPGEVRPEPAQAASADGLLYMFLHRDAEGKRRGAGLRKTEVQQVTVCGDASGAARRSDAVEQVCFFVCLFFPVWAGSVVAAALDDLIHVDTAADVAEGRRAAE